MLFDMKRCCVYPHAASTAAKHFALFRENFPFPSFFLEGEKVSWEKQRFRRQTSKEVRRGGRGRGRVGIVREVSKEAWRLCQAGWKRGGRVSFSQDFPSQLEGGDRYLTDIMCQKGARVFLSRAINTHSSFLLSVSGVIFFPEGQRDEMKQKCFQK